MKDASLNERVRMTAAGSLDARLFLSKNINAPSRPSSRKYSAIVVEIVLFPDPARPCNQRTFWFCEEGVVSQSVIHLRMSCRVPGKHDGREKASIRAGLSCFRCSMSTVKIIRFSTWRVEIAQNTFHTTNFPTSPKVLVETKTAWTILPESKDCLSSIKLRVSRSTAWPVSENACFVTLAENHVRTHDFCVYWSILTYETMSRIFPNENRTLDRLLEYLRHDIFQQLQFARNWLDNIDKRVDIFHSRYKINEPMISFKLSLDGLSRSWVNMNVEVSRRW